MSATKSPEYYASPNDRPLSMDELRLRLDNIQARAELDRLEGRCKDGIVETSGDFVIDETWKTKDEGATWTLVMFMKQPKNTYGEPSPPSRRPYRAPSVLTFSARDTIAMHIYSSFIMQNEGPFEPGWAAQAYRLADQFLEEHTKQAIR